MKFARLFRNWEDVAEYRARSVIFSEGDPVDVMYFIISGQVELTLQGAALGVEKEGGIIGEMAMISPAKRNSTATALTRVKLARMDREQFKKIIDGDTEFSLHVMAVLANRLRDVDNFITTHVKHNS